MVPDSRTQVQDVRTLQGELRKNFLLSISRLLCCIFPGTVINIAALYCHTGPAWWSSKLLHVLSPEMAQQEAKGPESNDEYTDCWLSSNQNFRSFLDVTLSLL